MKYEMSYIMNDNNVITNEVENDMTPLESIYIPRIYGNIEPGLIAYTFENMDLGVVRNIETCKRPDSTYMAFVYFSSWNTSNPAACNLAKRIRDPNVQARIVYDDPWYWILLPNKSEKSIKKNVEQTKDSATSTDELKNEQEIEILKLMVEDLQTRLLKSEKNQVKLQKELVDMRSILLTGETFKQTDKTHENQLTYVEKNMDLLTASSAKKKTFVEHYVPYYYDDIEVPPSPPKLIRQIATAGPIKPDEKFFPEPSKQAEQKSIRVDGMGLVYPDRDYGFWCDP